MTKRKNIVVGEIEETLKWGQPSYLTTQTKSGSLVRIDQIKSQAEKYAIYFHCQTTLVDTFKEMYRGQFVFEGNRSILFSVKDKVPVEALGHCISMALTYHLNKKQNNRSIGSKYRANNYSPLLHRSSPSFHQMFSLEF